ncbi:MAG: glycosyltransferase family 2 protein [Oscillospiraceae bacterium]
MNLRLKRIKELLKYLMDAIKQDGLKATFKRGVNFIKRRTQHKKGRFLPAASALERQKKTDFTLLPTISVCVPLFNTSQEYLQEMVSALLGQSCNKWELCCADASSDDQRRLFLEALHDSRIKYIKVENKGIGANTNAAAKLASGEYLALLDHDDVLSPNAIYEMSKTAYDTKAKFIYSDEALFTTDIKKPIVGHFKPCFAPDYLNCCNYICHFSAFTKELFWSVGGFDSACDGSGDHDLFLKLSEQAQPVHIPKVLYYWRVHEGSTSGGTSAKPYVTTAAIRAISNHLERIDVDGVVTEGLSQSTYKVEYVIKGTPLVSIIIPNKDHIDDLDKAIKSILEKTDYKNYEIIIIENNSENDETFAYYANLPQKCKVEYYNGSFNFSAINNFGRKYANGDYLLLLNNDVEIINDAWLREMLSLCVQKNVGIVGAKLYYADDTVQHAGVITGLGGYAGHSHKYAVRSSGGYMFRLNTVQDFSCVTAACLMVKANVYDEVGGMDEKFTVAFNDVDFCLRVRDKGYRVLYTPYAQLYHYESKSRGADTKGAAKQRFDGEQRLLKERYGKRLINDPYYSPNLTLDREDFSENDVFPRDI